MLRDDATHLLSTNGSVLNPCVFCNKFIPFVLRIGIELMHILKYIYPVRAEYKKPVHAEEERKRRLEARLEACSTTPTSWKKHMFWVYILQCNDNSYYTGHTDNLDNRLAQHHHKMIPTCYTSSRLPVQLVYSQSFPTREEALSAEKQIQGWTRKKKEALIHHDWKLVSYYAKRKNTQTSEESEQP